MPTFGNKRFESAAASRAFGARYRAAMAKHPFLLFGLPFMSVVVAGSFVLTPVAAVRYETHDRRVRQLTKEEELGLGKNRRQFDIREEYFVSALGVIPLDEIAEANSPSWSQRLQNKDLDNWEQKRVKRLPGEPDGVL
jgi:cytochrome c oxidase assembly protein subunit 16